jgi:hypothetical protein
MDNMLVTQNGNELTIKIDLSKKKDVGNKKTLRIASSEGNKIVATTPDGDEVFLGLNAYVYRIKK